MRRLSFRLVSLILYAATCAPLFAQSFGFRVDGPCGQVVEGEAGSAWDDGTGGTDYFFDRGLFREEFQEVPNERPGQTLDVVLDQRYGTLDCTMPDACCRSCCRERSVECVFDGDELVEQTVDVEEGELPAGGVGGWSWGIGVEGALSIVDITTSGTVSCAGGRFGMGPECLQVGGFEVVELTGPPLTLPDGRVIDRHGPRVAQNAGAISAVVLGDSAANVLPPDGPAVVAKLRVLAEFPPEGGKTAVGRLFFAPRTGSGQEVPIVVVFRGDPFAPSTDAPVTLKDCAVRFRGASPAADFVRCDPSGDGRSDVTDAVWTLRELFRDGPPARCREAADCDADGAVNVTDVVYGLSYLFTGGAAPPPPFPDCGSADGLSAEDCPSGSTACP